MKVLKTITILVISLMILAFTTNISPEKTISEKVAAKQNLSTLLTALQAADLVETLKGEGPYTVFAPTNNAFKNLPEGKLDELLKPENKAQLAKILKYHVVSGKIYASDLSGEKMVKTLEGTQIKVQASVSMEEDMDEQSTDMDRVRVNNATVVEPDITASNGIIHIIDGVVMPSDIEVMGATDY